MRVFWALIAVLVVAAGCVLLLQGGEPAPIVTTALDTSPSAATPPRPDPAPTPSKPVEPQPAASLDTALHDAAKDAGVKVDLPMPPPSLPADAAAEPKPALPDPLKPTPPPGASTPAPPPSEADVTDLVSTIAGGTPTPLPEVPVGVAITRNDDGSLLLDHRFTVRGEGTIDRPYEIAWEFLVSASETYKPRLGQKKLPDWLELINHRYVRITGFVAFPIMAESPDEMLIMLNQWDGCCIGVPPTPYDAVEIKLSNAVKGDDRLKTFGTVEGLFSVDPYLVKDWLIGLYLMKDAKLTNTTGLQTSPHITKPEP